MSRSASVAALFAALLLVCLTGQAGAAAPFTVDANGQAEDPAVAVDASGVGHFVWSTNVPSPGSDVLHYCQIPRNGTTCTKARTFAPPARESGSQDLWGAEVFLPDDETVVIYTARCCNEYGYAVVSHDSGQSFGPLNEVGNNEPSGHAALGPGAFSISTITHVETGGVFYQATPFESGGPLSARANIGEVGKGAANPAEDGTVGFIDPLTPVAALSDHDHVYFRRFNGGVAYNELAAWSPLTQLLDGDDPRLAGGPRGLFLLYRTPTPGSHYEVRRWNGTTFPAPGVAITADYGLREFIQDPGGGLHALYAIGSSLAQRVSNDGGKTFGPPTALANESISNLRSSSAKDGGGWAVWDNGSGPVRAVQYGPTGAVGEPPAGGAQCVATLKVGAATLLAKEGCGFAQVGKTDNYTTAGDIRVNGIDVVTAAGDTITVDLSARSVVSKGSVDTVVGPVKLAAGAIDWRIPAGAGGELKDKAGNPLAFDTSKAKTKVVGMAVSGQTFPFVDSKGRASVKVELALPEPFNGFTGGNVTGSATLSADNTNGLMLNGLHVRVQNTSLGIAQIKNFDLVYVKDPFLLQAGTDILLPAIGTEIKTDFGLNQGGFDYANADLIFDPPRALFTYVNLQHIKFHTNVFKDCKTPTNISLGAGLDLGPPNSPPAIAHVEGVGGYDFPKQSCNLPGRFYIDGVGSLVDFEVAKSHLQLTTYGQITFGGTLFTPQALKSIVSVVADYEGGFDLPSKQWYVSGGAQGSLLTIGTFPEVDWIASSKGARVCANITPFDVNVGLLEGGFHYFWGKGGEVDYPGCYGEDSAFTPAAFAAALGGRISQARGFVFKVGNNTSRTTVKIEGAVDAPGATLIDPRARQIMTPSPPANGASGEGFKAVRVPSQRATYVVLDKPEPGLWQVVAQPGSTITKVSTATGLPSPSVRGRVTGSGRARALDYTLRGIAGQSVRVFERGGGVSRSIGTLRAGRHRLAFRPADGRAGKRQLVAAVTSRGLPRANIVVATYTAPGPFRPARPLRVRLTRRANALRVTWGGSAGAARYVVRAVLRDGRRKEYVTTRRALTISRVPGIDSGRILVSGIGGNGLVGRSTLATFKAKPKTVKRKKPARR